MFITKAKTSQIPENVREKLIRRDLLREFKEYLRDIKFNQKTLNLVYQCILNCPSEIKNIMKYTKDAQDYDQVMEILSLIDIGVPEETIDLIYDENGNIRTPNQIFEIRNMYLENFEDEQIIRALKYEHHNALKFRIIKILVFYDCTDRIISEIEKMDRINENMRWNIEYLAVLYSSDQIDENTMLYFINFSSMDPREFQEYVRQRIGG